MVPTPRRTGPRFLKGLDARFMAARSARLSPKPGRAPYQFRKIQVCPKDLPAALRQAEPAVDRAHEAGCWWSLLGGRETHVPHEAPRLHHGARRRGSRVAARGARGSPRSKAATTTIPMRATTGRPALPRSDLASRRTTSSGSTIARSRSTGAVNAAGRMRRQRKHQKPQINMEEREHSGRSGQP
jgi:hypothetical protein